MGKFGQVLLEGFFEGFCMMVVEGPAIWVFPGEYAVWYGPCPDLPRAEWQPWHFYYEHHDTLDGALRAGITLFLLARQGHYIANPRHYAV